MIRYWQIILILFLLQGHTVLAQQKDFGLWTSVEAQASLFQDLDLELGLGNRLKDNLNQRDETYTDIGLSYKYGLFRAGVSYRFTNNNRDIPDVVYSHRFAYQFRFSPEWQRFTFDLRAKYQSQYFGIKSSENGSIPENFLRTRFRVSYNIKKMPLEPSASYELFYRIDPSAADNLERSRLTLGAEYSINKKNSVELSYIIHETFNKKNPALNYILSLEYKFEI